MAPIMFIFSPGIQSGIHTVYCVSLVSSSLCRPSAFPYFSCPWHCWKMLVFVFCKMSLHLGLSDVYSRWSWGYRFWQEWHRGDAMSFPAHDVTCYTLIHLITDINHDHLVRVVCATFLHCKVALFPSVFNKYFKKYFGHLYNELFWTWYSETKQIAYFFINSLVLTSLFIIWSCL